MSTVDVVIPCYNYGRYLGGCVQSVLSQEGVDVRVLVIDDASSDDTPQIGRELAAADPRVEFRRHSANRGHIATYNEGLIDWSTGDYAVLLSADDLLVPGALKRATRIMDDDPTVGLVYGRSFYFENEEQLNEVRVRDRGVTRWSGAEWLEGRCRAGHNVISSPEVVIRGSIQRRIGGYRAELPHVADFEMWLRVAAVSNIAYVRGGPQAFYRRHSASMTTSRTRLIDLDERRKTFDYFFGDHPALVNGAALHQMAQRALAREALWGACRAYDHNEVKQRGAAELVEFAVSTYPDAPALSEHAALRRRQWLGPVICNWTLLFGPQAIFQRVRNWLWWRRWQRQGV